MKQLNPPFDPRPNVTAQCNSLSQKSHAATDNWPCSPADDANLNTLLRRKANMSRLVLSNGYIRGASIKALQGVLENFYTDNPALKFFFVTIALTQWVTFVGGGQINIAKMKRQAYAITRRMGLEGVCSLDIAILNRAVLNEPRARLLPHFHIVAWTQDIAATPRTLRRPIRGMHSLKNDFGAKAVDIRKLSPDSAESVRHLGWYMHKPTLFAKQPELSQTTNSGFTLKNTHVGFRKREAVEMAVIWGQINAEQAITGVGVSGAKVRAAWKRKLVSSLKCKSGPYLDVLPHNSRVVGKD